MKWIREIYIKLFKIDDTPQRIALGIGLGICLGIIPGTGPIAALFLAFILRLNRAAALLGSLLTNTWLSITTFVFSIKLGSAIMKVNWRDVQQDWRAFILPVIIGYLIVALVLGLVFYVITFIILSWMKKHTYKKGRNL